jgi:iron-sulfur cluster assembly protein
MAEETLEMVQLGGTQTATPVPVENAPEGPVLLTAKALKMVKLTRDEEGMGANCGLRIAVRGGGCSGFEYALDFDNEVRDSDTVLEYDGLKLYVDPISGRYLDGTLIDYSLGMTGTGFKFHNPKAVGTCGCGSSFTV